MLHKLLFTRLHSTQVVRLWCEAEESDAWGKAATSTVLTQYYSGLSAVLIWLFSAPAALPYRVSSWGGPDPAARSSHLLIFSARVRTATRRSPCSPCSRPLADLTPRCGSTYLA